jgi:hypothetical protein
VPERWNGGGRQNLSEDGCDFNGHA